MTYTFKLARRLAALVVLSSLAVVVWRLSLLDVYGYLPYLTEEKLTQLMHSGVVRPLIVAFGCAAGRVFPFQSEFEGSRTWLRQMFPGRSPVFYSRTDFILCCVMGAALGMVVVQPASPQTALATGLSWPVIARRLIAEAKGKADSAPPR